MCASIAAGLLIAALFLRPAASQATLAQQECVYESSTTSVRFLSISSALFFCTSNALIQFDITSVLKNAAVHVRPPLSRTVHRIHRVEVYNATMDKRKIRTFTSIYVMPCCTKRGLARSVYRICPRSAHPYHQHVYRSRARSKNESANVLQTITQLMIDVLCDHSHSGPHR
jgi:hypothetical protein